MTLTHRDVYRQRRLSLYVEVDMSAVEVCVVLLLCVEAFEQDGGDFVGLAEYPLGGMIVVQSKCGNTGLVQSQSSLVHFSGIESRSVRL